MKDYYQLLGIATDANLDQIKKTYRKLAMRSHDDKGGDGEKMRDLNAANEVLSDPEKRKKYDANLKAFKESNVDEEPKVKISGYLHAGNTEPFSKKYQDEHKILTQEYETKPLLKDQAKNYLTPINTGIYEFDCKLDSKSVSKADNKINNIFEYIKHQPAADSKSRASNLDKPLTKQHAITIFCDFLQGRYYDSHLNELKKYLFTQVSKLKLADSDAHENNLYEGIYEVVLACDKTAYERRNLLYSLKKISDYAKKAADIDLPIILPLFFNAHFRYLFKYVTLTITFILVA